MDRSGSTSQPPSSRGESLFLEWLARQAGGDDEGFEVLCREHPELQAELRSLRVMHRRLLQVIQEAGGAESLSRQLASHFGSRVDPRVTLEPEERAQSGASAEVLSRLAGRGPASTRYRIKGEVAHGGMGAVLRVWDEDLRRHLAMKVMLGKAPLETTGQTPPVDQRLLARFLEEAQVTGQLDHPGIVPVHELGLDAQGHVYFTMKLVRGRTLKEVFDEFAAGQGGWTQTRLLGLLQKICEAMSYAHDKGVIHRDLKPANVMIGRYGEVYVMDWGLARIREREDHRDIRIREDSVALTSELRSDRQDLADSGSDSPLYTMDGDVVGTPAYMPPEQARGEQAAMGPHSDVYALGAILYHLLAGHMPYVRPGERTSNYAVWRWVREGPPADLALEAPGAPGELVAICERAMAREVHARYADMAALSADLSAFIEGRVVRTYETGAYAEARKWVRRNRALAGALAAAVIAVLVGAVAFALKARDATQAATLAQLNEQEANEQRDIAVAETAKVLRLSDGRLVSELNAEADELWPPHPERIAALESWLARARELTGKLELHRQTLARLREEAPLAGPQASPPRAHPRSAELADLREAHGKAVFQLGLELTDEQRRTTQVQVAQLEGQIDRLGREVEAIARWRFVSAEAQWQHDLLAELLDGLETLEAELLADDATFADHSWSVPKRLAFARGLQTGFAPGGAWTRAWEAALPAIRAAYPDLDLVPQMGLVPIGPDPDSGLWEFAHLMTGEPAQRDAGGRLVLTERTGVVLVLFGLDGFWMGAQAGDPNGRNYDPDAMGSERPVHEVELSAFFLSKFEMTQGQWLRLRGENPSLYGQSWNAPDGSHITLLHPIEEIAWQDCATWLPRAGLQLPSEAQWEYGARGGTDTPWWTGREREALAEQHAANLADRAAARAGAAWSTLEWPELDDGYIVHAEVGSLAANPFGLHEVAGNVFELCLDGYAADGYARAPRLDPVYPREGIMTRVARGGGYDYSHLVARSAARMYFPPAMHNGALGVRPARAVSE